MAKKSLHSICRWIFNAGKGGFAPADVRPDWAGRKSGTPEMIQLVAEKIQPRLPRRVLLGIEMHCDAEVDDHAAAAGTDALEGNRPYLVTVTPGAHMHFAYSGIASLDPKECKAAEELGMRTVDLVYNAPHEAWYPDKTPAFVSRDASFGHDVAVTLGGHGNFDIGHAARLGGTCRRVAKDTLIDGGSVGTVGPNRQLRPAWRDARESCDGTLKHAPGMVSGEALRILASVECLGLVAALGARPGFNFDSLSLCFAVAAVSVLLVPLNELVRHLRRISRVTVRRWKRWDCAIDLAGGNSRTRRRRN